MYIYIITKYYMGFTVIRKLNFEYMCIKIMYVARIWIIIFLYKLLII